MRKDMGYQKVGAVGYCYGGRVAVLLGATDLVETVVIAHPGSIDFDEMRAIKVRYNSDVTSLWV
jgi:carboxymethylenebutenolidase